MKRSPFGRVERKRERSEVNGTKEKTRKVKRKKMEHGCLLFEKHFLAHSLGQVVVHSCEEVVSFTDGQLHRIRTETWIQKHC